jgi:hypothetical protein
VTFRIRVLRPWGPLHRVIGDTEVSTDVPPADADALLCEWDVYDELFTFPGPAAWFSGEPRENPRMGVLAAPRWATAAMRLRPEQMLYPAHHDPRYRVPHPTHESAEVACVEVHGEPRRHAVVALVSNAGGRERDRWPEIELRNRFATSPGVDLYGPEWLWQPFRTGRWPWRRKVLGYRGEPDVAYVALGIGATAPPSPHMNNSVKIGLFSRYHTALCLENSCEPQYFTEKFVDGVRAGCVPVYHAHPTVRDGILRGARWVDPADFGMSARRTLRHALSLDRREVAEQNREWLRTDAVRATSVERVWERIAGILRAQARIPASPT